MGAFIEKNILSIYPTVYLHSQLMMYAGEKYIHRGIFFKFAVDPHNVYDGMTD